MRNFVRHLLLAALCFAVSQGTISAQEVPPLLKQKIGVVNFKKCVESSKLGKAEQEAFENLRKQMDKSLEEREKTLNEIAAKINDPDYLDNLSNEAEAELKHKFRSMNQELSLLQNQYYQALSQTNIRVVQKIQEKATTAAGKVAKQEGLAILFNEEACFFCAPELDKTQKVISVLDTMYDEDQKQGQNQPVANMLQRGAH